MLTNEDHVKIIIDIVTAKPGIKAVELVTEVINTSYLESEKRHPASTQTVSTEPVLAIPELLNEMVRSGTIVEVEYVLPTMNYRIKSLYFPAETEVNVV